MATAIEREQQHRAASGDQEKLKAVLAAHLVSVSPAGPAEARTRPVPDPPQRPERPSRDRFAAELLEQVPRWELGTRRVARRLAEEMADAEHERLLELHARATESHTSDAARIRAQQEAEQRLLDAAHERFLAGDPTAVAQAIDNALAGAGRSAQLDSLQGDRAALRVVAPAMERVIPEREPTWTATGKPSTRKLPQGERNDLYHDAICALALAVGRTALSVAPSLSSAAVTVSATVDRGEVPVAYCKVERNAWAPWGREADAVVSFHESDGLIEQTGRVRSLAPLDARQLNALADVSSA